MMKLAALTLAISTALSTSVLAQDTSTLTTYAMFAKVEANIVEAAGAVPLAVALADNPEGVATATEDFQKDKAQLEGYLDALSNAGLNEEQMAGLEGIKEHWANLSAQGEAVLAAPQEGSGVVLAWWNEMHDLEEEVDVLLEGILEENGISIE